MTFMVQIVDSAIEVHVYGRVERYASPNRRWRKGVFTAPVVASILLV